MLIKFTKDFARNWRAGEIVTAKYLGQGEMLVDNVAKVNSSLLFKHCKIISEPDCDKTGLTNKEFEYCKNDCVALNILEAPKDLYIFIGGRGNGKTYYTERRNKMIDYVKGDSEINIHEFLKRHEYKRIISIYPSGNKIVCWYEY